MSSSLSSLYDQLRVKEEQLNRLIICEGELQQSHSDFQSNKHLCMEPELASNTWFGTLANEFDQIRESSILASYEEIVGSQFSSIFAALSAKIAEIKAEIQRLKAEIAALEAALAAEAARTSASGAVPSRF